jgi:hypothetical protein
MYIYINEYLFFFCFRPNTSVPSPPSSETNERSPSSSPQQTMNTKTNVTLNRQTSDEFNSQQGKRKFSLSQYKERKRLKSNELQQDSLADTDMRINTMGNSKVRTTKCLMSSNIFLAAESSNTLVLLVNYR